MADFLLVVGEGPGAERWFARGLSAAREQGFGDPAARIERPGVRVATFARRAGGLGARIAEDGDPWLLVAGTRWDADTTGPGREFALLRNAARAGLTGALAGIDGFFAVAAGGPDGVQVATDAIGSHHVHARSGDGVTAIAGSALWLAALDDDAVDAVGCQEMLATGVMYEGRTPWSNVRALAPATIHDVRPEGVAAASEWWSIDALGHEELAGDDALEAFGDAMLETCEQLGRVIAKPVSDLTAGWDSRLLAAFLLHAGVPFETTVTGPAGSPDVLLSTRIAAALGLTHHPLPHGGPPTADEVFDATTLSDGLVNAILYARVLRVHRKLSARFGATLNGSFGEVARGYWWEILKPGPEGIGPLDAEAISRARYAAGAPGFDLWPPAERLDPVPHFAEVVARTDAPLTGARPLSFRMDHAYLRLRMRSWQGRIASSTDRLWPCVSPLIARPALESLLRTQARDRNRNRLARRALSRYAPDLARQPLESGGPAVPRSLGNAWRFAPEARRLLGKVANKLLGRRTHARTLEETSAPRLALLREERVRAALDPDRMALGDHVDRDALRRLLERMRRPDWPHELAFGNLLALELGLARARELRG